VSNGRGDTLINLLMSMSCTYASVVVAIDGITSLHIVIAQQDASHPPKESHKISLTI
jgi:hypothetical protein